MGAETGINWTDSTWGITHGCSRVSPGCGGSGGDGGAGGCYAEKMAGRFSGPGLPYEGLVRIGKQGARWTGEVRFIEHMLDQPLRWKKPRRIFVNSMSDLFHEKLSNEQIARVYAVMFVARRHTFQILTKRPERMRDFYKWIAEQMSRHCDLFGGARPTWPLPNVHLGVSAEDQQRLDERVPILLDTPAAVRWVSAEPLLGPLDLSVWLVDDLYRIGRAPRMELDWLVVGGESGPRARPFDLAWARSIVAQCKAADVPVWVKQLGADPIDGAAGCSVWQSTKAGSDIRDFPPELQVREFPEVRP